ncbi:hypothetical protein [Companilactobacillus mishanensis]|uniref:HicB-like antitoxin of toxin-antitoxin system domain-containing protein n=1 Tax=Companilactobacillus mishanensis TaxID=2486008 RepID=A0A5P0ZJM3_9LACO|nr:hypothetical protein [Companilactobacillus mishanensis]MQS53316.1 hypothetical protein [Companilactobacillus mishanensis]MQS88760.1 hypothetical protein [Companilactobacillus mishanensis]
MKAVYPVTMIKCDRDYSPYYINIPDFDFSFHAENIVDAMETARQNICKRIMKLNREGKVIPKSNSIIPTTYQSDIITLIDIDTDKYLNLPEKKRFKVMF